MADDFTSDEDKYANESFENETDNEIPEISTSENESDVDREYKKRQEMYASYTRYNNRNSFSKQYAKYESSSDDDDDVVISETIAEINTEPMVMEDACTARSFNTNTVRLCDQTRKQSVAEEEDAEDGNLDEEENSVLSDEEGEEEASEPETKATEQLNFEYSNTRPQYESETENEHENITNAFRTFVDQDVNLNQEQLECIQEERQKDKEEPMDELTLGQSPKDKPRIIRCRYVATNDDNYLMHEGSSIGSEFPNYRYANAEEVYSITEQETEAEAEPQFEYRISSQTPTSFNTNDYAFHMNFIRKTASTDKLRMKPTQRKSWSFTNERMREIERENQILLKKILTQKPTYTLNPQKSKQNLQNCNISSPSSYTRLSSAAINRKKQQRQIDLDNQVLKRKIEAIALRRPVL